MELLALVGLFFYTCETRRTNNLTQEGLNNFRDQMRPYISAVPAISNPTSVNTDVFARQVFDQQIIQTHTLKLDVGLRNLGTSIARVTSAPTPQIAIGYDAEAVAKECKVPLQPSDQILAPDGPNHGGNMVLHVAETRTLGDFEISELRRPNSGFRVVWFGEVRYTSLRGGITLPSSVTYMFLPECPSERAA